MSAVRAAGVRRTVQQVGPVIARIAPCKFTPRAINDVGLHAVQHAVVESGNAIKGPVAANIIPGDMLWKNFDVTRHDKVVFYDHDEIECLTDCNFRRVPTARNEEEEMSGEVWYRVAPKDVFPETFAPFLLGNPQAREVFMAQHADLLDAAFWQGHKDRIKAGHVHGVFPCVFPYVFPYRPAKRFRVGAP